VINKANGDIGTSLGSKINSRNYLTSILPSNTMLLNRHNWSQITADSVPTMATFSKWLSAVTEEIKRLRGEARKQAPESQNKAPVSRD
jgi:hypothetical protein